MSVLNDGAAAPLAGLRILLAEDSQDNQRLIHLLLRRQGAEVAVVGDGQAAVDLLLQIQACRPTHEQGEGGLDNTQTSFDAVLMDMQMPVLDGYAATRSLREHGYPGPIIALTAHSAESDREKCLAAGCNDYVAKPVDLPRLLSALRRNLQTPTTEAQTVQIAPAPAPAATEVEFAAQLALLKASFVAGLPQRMSAVEEAHAGADMARLAALAHQLRGAGGSYGYLAISQAALRLEAATAHASHVELAEAVVALRAACELPREHHGSNALPYDSSAPTAKS